MQPCERRPLLDVVQDRLQQREAAGLLRKRLCREGPQQPQQRLDSAPMISFCSNDYLGLANHPQVIEAFQRAANRYGVGSGASHLVSGHCSAHQQLEEELADFTGRDKALLFSTGYMANVGTINALMSAGDLVLQDELNHASLLDGGWLSKADSRRFPHRDMAALENDLAGAPPGQLLIATDGVFSMDGDTAALAELVVLSRRSRAWLMVDDAHGIGCVGRGGRGVLAMDDQEFSQDEVPILVGTLGKAFGTAGAFVAGDESLIDYLTQFARPYVFSTALPPAIAEASIAALTLARQEVWRRQRLQELISRLRAGISALGLPLLESYTPIQSIVFGDVHSSLQASRILASQGLHVSAIRPPTVPQGTARLRITLSAAHSDEQLERLLEALQLVSRSLEMSAA